MGDEYNNIYIYGDGNFIESANTKTINNELSEVLLENEKLKEDLGWAEKQLVILNKLVKKILDEQ